MMQPPYAQNALLSLMASPVHAVRDAAIDVAERIALEKSESLDRALRDALTTATDENAPASERARATRVLGLNPAALPLNAFAQLLSPRQPDPVRHAAAEALARRDAPQAMALLVAQWPSATPHTRGVIENAFTSEPKKIAFLFDAIARNQLNPSLLSRPARSRLVAYPDKEIQQRAEKLFAASLTDDRDKVVTSFYESTTMGGDAAKGRRVFQKTCSTCHLLENVGHAFGPDLMSITNQTRINLLTMILDPNNNIAAGYDGYSLETTDGRALTGIMAGETSSGVMLRTPEGLEQSIPRERIKTIRPLAQSLMPEGLEAGLEKQDIADLLTYLKGGR
jgi:putative heme-binding domain-containing protein